MLPVTRMIGRTVQRLAFPRRGERQSPLLGGEGWVRTVVKLTFDGRLQRLAHRKELGNGGATNPGDKAPSRVKSICGLI